MVMVWLWCGCGMEPELIALIALTAAVNAVLTIFMARMIATGLKSEFSALDLKIAQAIAQVIEADLSDLIPPANEGLLNSPEVKSFFIDRFKSMMDPTIQVNEIRAKDKTGKYV